MKIRRSLLKDTVTVESYLGEGAYGPSYGDPVTVQCDMDPTRRLVRGANGEEVVSSGTFTLHPNDADLFVPQSRLTIGSRTTTLISLDEQMFRGRVVFWKAVYL